MATDGRPSTSSLLPSDELLAYYKQRVGRPGVPPAVSCLALLAVRLPPPPPTDTFEAEREELLKGLDKCAVQQADLHKLEWENRKRVEEIRELQKVRQAQELPAAGWLSAS
jgi:hypothetical protein